MELYQRSPDKIIRIKITKQGFPIEYFTVWQCTMEEAHAHFQKVMMSQKLPMTFDKEMVTNVRVQETKGDGKNGKSKSFSFKGLTPKETKDILIKSIK